MSIKTAYAQALLRRLHEKNAMTGPLIAGAAIAGGVHMTGKSLGKAREYKAGFQPGIGLRGRQ